MAHEIDFSKGRPAFVYSMEEGEAWHGLGHAIPEEHACDPRKIAELAGADYTVSKRDIFYMAGNVQRVVPNRQVLTRDDTAEALEVLSENKYKIVQPVEYFEAFRDALSANHLRISSAGVLKGGRIVFANAKFTDHGFDVLGKDHLDTYVCIGGGYDGKLASFGFLNSQRSVCWNTLSVNLANSADGGKLFRVAHSAAFNGKQLGAAMGLAGKELAIRAEVFNTLAGRKANNETVARFFAEVMGIEPEDMHKTTAKGQPVLSAKARSTLDALADAYLHGPGSDLASANGTLWGAVNAVTYYQDHVAPTRDSYADGKGAARFASATFGTGAQVKRKALELAMQQAGIGSQMLLAA